MNALPRGGACLLLPFFMEDIGMFAKKGICAGLVVVMLAVFGGQTMAQGTLAELVEQEGFGWLVGRWTATTDDGTEIQITYRWAVGKQAIIVDLKMGEHSSHGMIFYSPKNGEVVEVAVDSRGSVSMGTWDAVDGKAVSKSESTQPDGQTFSYAVTREKVNRNTMRVAMYGVDDGVIADDAWATLEFKRQKRQPRAKNTNATGADAAAEPPK